MGICALTQLSRCFCGSTQDPKPPRLATPHSCGNSCARSRLCGHPCPLPCHPGPCPPCMITIQNPCHCGKDTIALVCSRANPTTSGRVALLANRSCGHKCGKPLFCQNHVCQDICHDGECTPCAVTDLARCWCGKERKQLACGAGEDKECNIISSHGEESWIGKFDCGNLCERSVVVYIFRCRHTPLTYHQAFRLWYPQMPQDLPFTIARAPQVPLFSSRRDSLSVWQTVTD